MSAGWREMDGLPVIREAQQLGEAAPETVLHTPSVADMLGCQMAEFAAWLAGQGLLAEPAGPEALQRYAVQDYRGFWSAFLRWSGLDCSGEAEPVCTGDDCETARFFPGLRLNYAANLLSPRWDDAAPAVTALVPGRPAERLSRGALRQRVARLATVLQQLGLRPGDRVGAVMRNDAEAVVAALAVAALGATLSTAAPEMGSEAILDRFAQLDPVLLLAHLRPAAQDTGLALTTRLAQVARGLPACRGVVALDGPAEIPELLLPLHDAAALCAAVRAEAAWQEHPFNQPLFILFSSGTTGQPKCIVHGAGGTLIEHVKEHRLHSELRPGDKLFFQTSCGWMMWNWQLSALASGAEIVTYSGPIAEADTLWSLVEQERVTHFGTSPGYLKMSETARLHPARDHDLSALRVILSTGSVLDEARYHWVRRKVGDLPLHSISGGTDIIGCFVLGHPQRPVHAGQSQARSLGLDVRVLSEEGQDRPGAVGELVCANPFPSRPLGFHGDADGSRFHQAYFAQNPGVWTHGDLAEATPEGGIRIHGRSDGIMKVRGIRIGPAEIYRVLRRFPEIRDAMVVLQRDPEVASEGRAVLALVLEAGRTLDGPLIAEIRRALAREASAAHVPDLFLQVAELPVTHTGKPSEAAMRDAVNGLPVRNLSALANPGCLEALRHHPALRHAPLASPLAARAAAAGTLNFLRELWQELLGIAPIAAEDDFFALGGHSLLAARLFAEIERVKGVRLPLTTLLRAPTVAALAALVDAPEPAPPGGRLVVMREGEAGAGPPLFLIHSMAGRVMELWALQRALRTGRRIYGIQAQGLEPGGAAQSCVHAMAADYLRILREAQPRGPYWLGGYSFGGLVALEMAQRLRREGEVVEQLIAIDTSVHPRFLPGPQRMHHLVSRPLRVARDMRTRGLRGNLDFLGKKGMMLLDRARVRLGRPARHLDLVGDLTADAHLPEDLRRVRGGIMLATRNYRPRPYAGKVTLIHAMQGGTYDILPTWRRLAGENLTLLPTEGDHLTMIQEPQVRSLARRLDAVLRG